MVVAPEVFSNPYVTSGDRDQRRFRFMAAISGQAADPGRTLCELLAEAGKGSMAFFLLRNENIVDTDAVDLVWRSHHNSLYRVRLVSCGPADG